jgi:hypothetical protein
MSRQADNNCPSDRESEDRLIETPEHLLERLISRRTLFVKSLGVTGALGALSLQAGAADDDSGQACVSREDIRRLALSAGTTVLQIVQAELPLVEQAEGNREQFIETTLQQLQDNQAITEREKGLLQEMTTVVFNTEQSQQEVIKKLRGIFERIAGQRNASPVAIALAGIARDTAEDVATHNQDGFSSVLGRAVIGAVAGGAAGAILGTAFGSAINGPVGAGVGIDLELVSGAIIGGTIGITLPDVVDFFEGLF